LADQNLPSEAFESDDGYESDATPSKPLEVIPEIERLSALLLHRLDEDQAQDVVIIDLKGKSAMADTIVIASGRSARHVSSMADHLLRAIKDAGFGKANVEGLPGADWVLIDALDIIVHLFRPEVRSFYNIEKIWSVEPNGGGHRGVAPDSEFA
jgi:ribosome-associated protein